MLEVIDVVVVVVKRGAGGDCCCGGERCDGGGRFVFYRAPALLASPHKGMEREAEL